MTCLIDGVHDLKSFDAILKQRVEEKTSYNKEKMEIQQAIKHLEAEQSEILKKQQEPEFIE